MCKSDDVKQTNVTGARRGESELDTDNYELDTLAKKKGTAD